MMSFREGSGSFWCLACCCFINPSWRTYDMLPHVGSHMDGSIKRENDKSNSPPLHVTAVSKKLLVIE